jgi:hypothetical protein
VCCRDRVEDAPKPKREALTHAILPDSREPNRNARISRTEPVAVAVAAAAAAVVVLKNNKKQSSMHS